MKSVLAAIAWACLAALIPAAAAADELTLRAAPLPVVDVQVNERPARFIVDATLPDVIVFSPAAARRLGVGPVPLVRAQVALEDMSITGRVARPRIVFANGRGARALAGLFGAAYTADPAIDGAIGPGVAPYDRVRIVLREGAPGSVARTFALKNAEYWRARDVLAGESVSVAFDLGREETVLSRPLTQLLADSLLLTVAGAPIQTAYPLGLSTLTQPVTTAQAVGGFAFGPTLARTDAPIAAPDGVDVIRVVARKGDPPRYEVVLGRAALAACTDMVWARAAKRLVVNCDR